MRNPVLLNISFNKRVFLLFAVLMVVCHRAFAQSPKITNFSPSSAYQGATITITGNNFKDVKDVKLGASPAIM